MKFPDEELTVLVCMLVSDGPARVPGAVQERCSGCGFMVWVAPSSLKDRRVGWRTACLVCALRHKKPQESARILPPTESQLSEIRANLNPPPP